VGACFGWDGGTDISMKMTWQHLVFIEEPIDFGEYAFEMHRLHHGVMVQKIEARCSQRLTGISISN
jgi:hypothetical protein